MTVAELMTANPATVGADDTLETAQKVPSASAQEAARALGEYGFKVLAVHQ